MSVIVIKVVPQGIIFGADRYRTRTFPGGQEQIEVTKVLKSANEKILVGSVGNGEIAGKSAQGWLKEFIDLRQDTEFEELAKQVKEEVERERKKTDGQTPKGQIINLATFVEKKGMRVPSIRYISNYHSLVNGMYTDIRPEFGYPDEFQTKLPVEPELVRPILTALANDFNPFWFHHSVGLSDFNILESFIKQAMRTISTQNKRTPPATLEEWERLVTMSVLTYGAFFEAFAPLGHRSVGGGADVVSLRWD